jgi:hypothetical protein
MKADFSGYATKVGLKCSDGRTIMPNAFKHQDKVTVPLVWMHMRNAPENILGHAVLEHRADGVYTYCYFNETEAGKTAKNLVEHKDITQLSIYANQLTQQGANVTHGDIKEVSLVLAGANPGAYIVNVNIQHGDGYEIVEDEAIIYTGLEFQHQDEAGEVMSGTTETAEVEENTEVQHSDEELAAVIDTMNDAQKNAVHFLIGEALAHSNENKEESGEALQHAEETVQDVFDTLTDKQKEVVYFLIGSAVDNAGSGATDSTTSNTSSTDNNVQHNQEGTTDMGSRNVFDQTTDAPSGVKHLTHSQIQTIVNDAQKMGSFKESFLSHAAEYGIENIDLLFPEAKTLSNTPELLARQTEWVVKVLGAVKKTPFAKIKSLVADLTAEQARAKGYVKGNKKTEEVLKMLRRTTSATTVYKKQKLDRDDVVDITDFDVIVWLKWEIRFMLDEELARAILIGDGRTALDPDKIKDPEGAIDGIGIRSIVHDDELYAVQVELVANVSADVVVDEITRARTQYRGSGSPTLYTTDKVLTDLLLLKDKMGRRLYETDTALAAALRVKEIVAVEVMEETPEIMAIIVNLVDYSLGANKGGEVNFFEDFDLDFNQNKYLMETRCSGGLTKPKSAIVVRRQQGTAVTPTAPSFDGATNTITVPTKAGVVYTINEEPVTGNVVIATDTDIEAIADTGYYIPANTTVLWTFTYTAA